MNEKKGSDISERQFELKRAWQRSIEKEIDRTRERLRERQGRYKWIKNRRERGKGSVSLKYRANNDLQK